MMTIYGDINDISVGMHYEQLVNRTFALLYIYEEQPFITYQRHVHDLLLEVLSFDKILLQKNKYFCKFISIVASLEEPNPRKNETPHSFVRRRILDATNLMKIIFEDVKEVLNESKYIEET